MHRSRRCKTDARRIAASSSITASGGSQHLSIKFTERPVEAGHKASVGSVGDCYANARADTVNRLYKMEVIWRRGPWKSLEVIEALTWVDWFKHRRLLEPIENIPPAEAEQRYFTGMDQVKITKEKQHQAA